MALLPTLRTATATWLLLVAFSAPLRAADAPATAGDKQTPLIKRLQSDAPKAEKAIACKQLAIYGSKDAVPALAALLPDAELSSWARIALEAIPGPEADTALREALNLVKGRQLIGVINSIGFRRDPKAASNLTDRLVDADNDIAAAAAEALGRIGGPEAVRALEKALPGVAAPVRASVALGLLFAAERFAAEAQAEQAAAVYDHLRRADIPKRRKLEATRGLILAQGPAGLPLLVEQLRTDDRETFQMALRTARELKGEAVTSALTSELRSAGADRQGSLLLVLADRGDARAWPAILDAAKTGPASVRRVAVGVLEHTAGAGAARVPVLLEAAVDADADLSQAAKAVLGRLAGNDVDAEVSTRLGQARGPMRLVLLDLIGRRRIDAALPVTVGLLADPDSATRMAAIAAVGAIGRTAEAADLVRALGKTTVAEDRQNLEKALMALGSRAGAACTPHVLTLLQSQDAALRVVGLHALSSFGGPAALAAVQAAVADKDGEVADAAVSTLSTWADNWPEDDGVGEPLLALAKSSPKPQYRVLALRGYLRFVEETKTLKDDDRVARIKQVLPLATRPEEKRLAIASLGTIPAAGALELLTTFAADGEVTEEACLSLVGLASRTDLPALSTDVRRRALELAVAQSKNDATRRKAEKALKALK